MDMKLTDKEDVSHWYQILHKQLKTHNAQTVLFQTETEIVSHQTFQSHAELVTWVTETETAFKYHHQYPNPHQMPQVHAHAKEQLMNYKQKSQYCKLPLLIYHSLSLNHKQPTEKHQQAYRNFKSKLK